MKSALRKKPPFWCRHKDASGKLDHLDGILREEDKDLCQAHQAEADAAKAKLLAPIKKEEEPELTTEAPVGRVWPASEDQEDEDAPGQSQPTEAEEDAVICRGCSDPSSDCAACGEDHP